MDEEKQKINMTKYIFNDIKNKDISFKHNNDYK